MLKSIRWTMQLWHAGLLAVVLLAFGVATFYEVRQARYAQMDADLERTTQLIAASIRPPWGHRRGGPDGPGRPDGPPDGPPDGRGGYGGPEGRGRPGNNPDDGPPPDERGYGPPPKPHIELPAALDGRFSTKSPAVDYFVVFDHDGGILAQSPAAPQVPMPPQLEGEGPPPWMDNNPRDGQPPLDRRPPEARAPLKRWRNGVREAAVHAPFGVEVVVGHAPLVEEHDLRQFAGLMLLTGVGVMLIGLAGGLVLASRVVRPINSMTAAAETISATNLSRRIDIEGTRNELDRLAGVLNGTFGRLESAFAQQVRFAADASHELRTPLAVIHTSIQLALSRDRSAEEYKKTLLTCQRASVRMKDLVDSLLLLAGADAGRLGLQLQPVEFADLVNDCVELITPLGVEKQVTIETELSDITLSGDAMRLGQVVTNLLSNAVRYNRDGGRVKVSLKRVGDDVVLAVEDTGVGIPPEHVAHLFERFYRVDAARSRAEGGSGLGLSIVQSIVAAHGGKISVASTPGQGTTFMMCLPIAASAGLTIASGTPS